MSLTAHIRELSLLFRKFSSFLSSEKIFVELTNSVIEAEVLLYSKMSNCQDALPCPVRGPGLKSTVLHYICFVRVQDTVCRAVCNTLLKARSKRMNKISMIMFHGIMNCAGEFPNITARKILQELFLASASAESCTARIALLSLHVTFIKSWLDVQRFTRRRVKSVYCYQIPGVTFIYNQ